MWQRPELVASVAKSSLPPAAATRRAIVSAAIRIGSRRLGFGCWHWFRRNRLLPAALGLFGRLGRLGRLGRCISRNGFLHRCRFDRSFSLGLAGALGLGRGFFGYGLSKRSFLGDNLDSRRFVGVGLLAAAALGLGRGFCFSCGLSGFCNWLAVAISLSIAAIGCLGLLAFAAQFAFTAATAAAPPPTTPAPLARGIVVFAFDPFGAFSGGLSRFSVTIFGFGRRTLLGIALCASVSPVTATAPTPTAAARLAAILAPVAGAIVAVLGLVFSLEFFLVLDHVVIVFFDHDGFEFGGEFRTRTR